MANGGSGGGGGGGGGQNVNQSGCSQNDEFNKAFDELRSEYTPQNFFEELLINSIGGGLGAGLKKIIAGIYASGGTQAVSTGVKNLADGVGSLAAGVTGGSINSVSGVDSSDPNFGLSAADVAAIAASVGAGLVGGAAATAALAGSALGPFGAAIAAFAAGVAAASIVGALAGIAANAFDLAQARYQECIKNEEEQEEEPVPGDDEPIKCPPVSPLIIDLDGGGVETVSLAASQTFFDLDGNGFAQNTGWVSPDDALLVLDRDASGGIEDISELFGSATEDGFSELAREDSSGDGIIDAQDAVFDDLRLWQDANQDGVAQEEELISLEDAGIVSIDSKATEVDIDVAAGNVSDVSTVTRTDGTTAEIIDVWFDNNAATTQGIQQREVSVAADRLPFLRGSGRVEDLQVAMTEDPALMEQVRDLLINSHKLSSTEYRAAFEEIIFAWTGVADVTDDSRGPYVNGQHLAAMEVLYDYDYDYQQLTGVNAGRTIPGPNAGYELELQFDKIIDGMLTQFAAQSAYATILLATDLSLADDPRTQDAFEALANPNSLILGQMSYDAELNRVSIVGAGNAIKTIIDNLPENAGAEDLDPVFSKLAGLQHQNFGGDADAFGNWLSEQMSGLNDVALRELAINIALGKEVLLGSENDDTLNANDAKPDFLVRQPQPISSVLSGGEGNDQLDGNAGGDVYVFGRGDGQDTINDSFFDGVGGFGSGTIVDVRGNSLTGETQSNFLASKDKILFLDRTSDEAIFTVDGLDLVITFNDGSTDSVRVTDQFAFSEGGDIDRFEYGAGTYNVIEEFIFADSVVRPSDISSTDGDDILNLTPFDDTVAGGLGNDIIRGAGGHDAFLYARGDGQDTIQETTNDSNDYIRGEFTADRLVLTDSLLTDITLTRDGDDAVIAFNSGDDGSIRFADQPVSNTRGSYPGGAVEGIEFSNGSLLRTDLVDLALNGDAATANFANVFTTADANGAGEVLGNQTSSRANDIFLGGADAVTFNGFEGHDTYILHAGDAAVTIVDRVAEFGTINGFADDQDTLILRDFTFDQLTFERSGTNMTVFADGTEIATVTTQYRSNSTFGIERRDGIETIIDANGQIFEQTDWEARTLTVGTDGNDNAGGISYTRNDDTVYYNNDSYDMGLGDDRINESSGSDTYFYSSGDGNDSIFDRISTFRNNPGNDTDRLVLRDLNLEDIRLERVDIFDPTSEVFEPSFGFGSLRLVDIATNQSIELFSQFNTEQEGIEELEFADGTVLDRAQIAANSAIFGTDFEDNVDLFGVSDPVTIDLMQGDDTFVASDGDVRMLYASGDGNDLVSGVRVLEFKDINIEDVRLTRSTNDILLVEIIPTGEIIEFGGGGGGGSFPPLVGAPVPQFEAPPMEGPDGPETAALDLSGEFLTRLPEEIRFASGAVWTRDDIIAAIELPTTEGDDIVAGTDDGDLINGLGGDDDLSGGIGDDLISGGIGADSLFGGAGNDVLFLSDDGDVTIVGGEGDDTVDASELSAGATIDLAAGDANGTPIAGVENANGSAFADTLSGTDADNTLNGGAGEDTLNGAGGDDLLNGGRGADDLNGGTGIDTASYRGALGGVAVSLASGVGTQGDANGDTLTDIENLAGSNYADILTGDGLDNVIDGGAGSDLIDGGAGNDTLDGGAGLDTITGGDGDDVIAGGAQADYLLGGAGADDLTGGNGTDALVGGEGSDVYNWTTGDGDDLINDEGASTDVDVLRLIGVDPAKVTYVRQGDDLNVFVDGKETIRIEDQFLGNGIEQIVFDGDITVERSTFQGEVKTLANFTPIGNDDSGFEVSAAGTIIAASDLLANDYDYEGAALTIIAVSNVVGGTALIDGNNDVVFTADGTSPTPSFDYTVSDGELSSVASVSLTVPTNKAPVVGTTLENQSSAEDQAVSFTLPADAFSDVDGDVLTVSATNADGSALPAWLAFDGATFSGQPPADFNGDIAVTVTASDGQASAAQGFVLSITAVNDAPVAGDDTLPDVVEGTTFTFAAADLLGNDSDPDNDTLTVTSVTQTGAGQVSLNGDGTISYTAATGTTGPDNFAYTVSDGALSATANVALTVTPENPYEGFFIGTNSGEFLSSFWVGNLNIFGASGSDTIFGSWGDNILAGGNGKDRLFGSFGDDDLFGGTGRDYLSGGSGNDLLDGGAGRDILRGGFGADTFVFAEGDGRDRVTDYLSNDVIAIDHAAFDSFADIESAISSSWRGTRINLGDGDVITLDWVRASSLDADDFVFL